jgi:hypothetical protein
MWLSLLWRFRGERRRNRVPRKKQEFNLLGREDREQRHTTALRQSPEDLQL